ncbi:unnamed protein product [Rhizoctonia solani]|uniref:Uncharacterized protein n=1 Tax=Rhizoctonia solani TaxID=456999 RepID=A0A8H3HUV8_9AGAM|nr:unnamed protein product [Rhizoctonia solani]
MLTGVLLWIVAVAALPLDGETACEIEGRSPSDSGRNVYRSVRRLLVERQDSGSPASSGPALGVILGGVFGAFGGLAIAGILFYAWWSVRRMRGRYATEGEGGSSSGPSSSTSRGSSSRPKSKKKRPKDGPKWNDPWLSPAPKSPRTPTAMQFHVPVDVAKVPGPQDDRGSDSSAIPLKPIYPDGKQ